MEAKSEIVIANPRGDIQKASDISSAIMRRRDEIAIEIDANPVTRDNYADESTSSTQKKLKDAVEDLRSKGKEFLKLVVDESGAMPIIVAIDSRLVTHSTKADPSSAYASLSARLKQRDDEIKKFKEFDAPPIPRHTYIIQAEMTDKDLEAVCKAMDKCGAVYRYDCPQTDAAAQMIEEFFNSNK